MAHLFLAWGSLIVCAGFALIFGGAPERIAGATYLLASIITDLTLTSMHRRYGSFETAAFLVDLLVYAIFLALVMKANRFWPPWLAAMQGASLLGYGLGVIEWLPIGLTSAILVQMWTYPIHALLLIGSCRHLSRMRQYGMDPPWSRRVADEFVL